MDDKLRQTIKETLIFLLNRSLMLNGPDDIRVIDLSRDFTRAKTIGPRGTIGSVMAEIILP